MNKKIVKGLFLLTSKACPLRGKYCRRRYGRSRKFQILPTDQKNLQKTKVRKALAVCARTEEEIAEMDDDEKQEFLEMEGVEESGLDRFDPRILQITGLGNVLYCWW